VKDGSFVNFEDLWNKFSSKHPEQLSNLTNSSFFKIESRIEETLIDAGKTEQISISTEQVSIANKTETIEEIVEKEVKIVVPTFKTSRNTRTQRKFTTNDLPRRKYTDFGRLMNNLLHKTMRSPELSPIRTSDEKPRQKQKQISNLQISPSNNCFEYVPEKRSFDSQAEISFSLTPRVCSCIKVI